MPPLNVISYHGAEWRPTSFDPWGNVPHTWEWIEQELVRDSFMPGDRAVVAGVGFGFILAGVTHRCGPGTLGVEANADLARYVAENVIVCGRAVEVRHAAITPTGLPAQLPPGRVWAVRGAVEAADGPVPGVSLSTLLADGYDTLLLDVEGGEWQLLPKIDSRWKKVIVELHAPYEVDPLAAAASLENRGLHPTAVRWTPDGGTAWIAAARHRA